MTSAFSYIVSLISQPRNTFRRLTLNSPILPATIVLAGTILSLLLHIWSMHNDVFISNPAAFIYHAPFHILVLLTGLCLFCAVWHFSADIFGGAGRGLTLQYFIVLSTIPFWLAGPISALFNIGLSMSGLVPIIFVFLSIWSLFLIVIAMMELYRFSALKACLNLLAAPVILTLLALGLLFLVPSEFISLW